ncbi:MAG: N-acetyltransferase [Treponemataceae bacterium]|nr:MAG: N-acetyltransferase [Treponemataceae bacterium]
MSGKIYITDDNSPDYFTLDILTDKSNLSEFDCGIEEYNTYLRRDALQGQAEFLAVTWLLRDLNENNYVAYMAITADAIKLSVEEKTLHNLNYPFRTLPAMKIAKLAVSKTAKEKYAGIGTNMLSIASHIARMTNGDRFACRFLTVDADIENDAGVTEFYRKNGFLANKAMRKKSNITINMRRDLFL